MVNLCDDGVANASDLSSFNHNYTGGGGTFEKVVDGIKATSTQDCKYLIVGYDVHKQQKKQIAIGKKYYGVADVTVHNFTSSESHVLFRTNFGLRGSTTLTKGRGIVQQIFTFENLEGNNGWVAVGTNNTNVSSGDSFTVHSMSVYEITDEETKLSYEELGSKYPIKCVGMQSVKMPVLKTTGKNLFDGKMAQGTVMGLTGIIVEHGERMRSDYIPVNTNNITVSCLSGKWVGVFAYREDKSYIGYASSTGSATYETQEKISFVIISTEEAENYSTTIQVEENSISTSYEPYKSNILTVNEEVELRGIGDVKDELDLQTGRLTQRIGEVVLNGANINWYTHESQIDGTQTYYASTNYFDNVLKPYGRITSDFLPEGKTWNTDYECIELQGVSGGYNFRIRINNSRLPEVSIKGLNSFLKSNPITVQYELATPIIKTIDLTVLDQDGNELPHIQTQPTVTHITASSDYLIPTVTINNNLSYDTIIKPSTLYTIRFKHDTVNADNPLTVDLGGTVQTVTSTEFTITTPSTLTHNQLQFSGKGNVVSKVQVIEGDVTGIEYPYFEGMNDVKFSDSKFVSKGKNIWQWGDLLDVGVAEVVVNLEPGEYWFSCNSSITYDTRPVVVFFDENFVQIAYGFADESSYYNLPVKTRMIYIYSNGYSYINSINNLTSFTNIMLTKEHHVKTDYEPYRCVEVQQDVDSIPLTSDMFEQGYYDYNYINGYSLQQMVKQDSDIRLRSKTLIPVKPNSRYILNNDAMYLWCLAFDKDGLYLGYRIGTIGETIVSEFTTDSFTHFIVPVIFNSATGNGNTPPSILDSMNLVLQEVPQEIVLRGIGDVKDELDLTRGEYIQRIGEAVYEKTALLSRVATDIVDNGCAVICVNNGLKQSLHNGNVKTDKLSTILINTQYRNYTKGVFENPTNIVLFDTTVASAEEFAEKYKDITIQYVLATPIIHKVNLTNTKVIPSYASKTTYTTQQPQDSLIPNITIPSTLNYNVAIKPSTEYTIRANTSDNLTVNLGGATGTLSNGKVTLTTPATLTHNEVKFGGTGKVKELMVVEGSEIKDNVPFFNGMKDVQMGGIKLVNIARGATCNNLVTTNTNKTQFTYTGNGNNWGDIFFDKSLLKPNTLYTIYFNIVSNNSNAAEPIKISLGDDLNTWVNATGTGLVKKTFSSNDNLNNNFGIMFRPCTSGQKIVIQNPMVIEGDWTHLDEIPYIESEMIIDQPIIRSQGKNLFDINKVAEHSSIVKDGNTLIMTRENPNDRDWVKVDISLPKGTYTFSCSGVDGTIFRFSAFTYDNVEIYSWQKFNQTYTFNTDIAYLKISTETIGVTYNVTNIQIEEGSTATPYEPYKHQTLYSNRVIGYEENCYYDSSDGIKHTHNYVNSVIADVEGLSIAYITNVSTNITFWDKDNIFISGKPHIDTGLSNPDVNGFVIVPSNAKYVKFASGNVSEEYATYYTKAAVTGDLPLRSLPNGVCDTLNLVTGEYVQRVGEVVLDGSQKEEDWLYTPTNQTLRIQVMDVVSIQNTSTDPLRNKILVSSDKLTSRAYVEDWNSGTFISLALDKRIVLRIKGITNRSELIKYLKQNPITVQYQLATPIVRKLGFTTKGNYREQVLDGSETWAMDAIDNTTTVRMTKKTTSPLQNPLYDTVLFTDDYHVRARDESHSTYEYITCIGNGIYINIYQSKVNELSVEGCTQWLSQNPIKVGYITSGQSSESYSNIHKPIFFNDVNVKFLNNNIDIQPELTYQVRTRNSYVMDMMKPNTTYTSKFLLSNNGSTTVDGTTINTKINSTFTSPSTLTNKLMITPINRHEFMIIEGDVTGKNLPYFKGILSSYHDVDEIEVYSATKNLFNIHDVQIESNKWETIIDTEKCKITSKRVIEDNTGAFATRIVINNIKPSTRYCLRWVSDNGGMIYVYTTELWDSANQLTATHGSDGKAIFYTPANTDKIVIGLNYGDTNGLSGKDYRTLSDIALYEIGVNEEITEKPAYIPHAHNTTRIEMPTRLETVKVVRPVIESGSIHTETGESFDRDDAPVRNVRTSYIPVEPNEMIKFYNGNSGRAVNVFYYDIDKQFIGFEYYDGTSASPTVPKNCYFVRMYCGKATCDDITFVRSAYKPIQLNSLPNGTSDEIIIKPNTNKAQLVQRVGKTILDNSLYWTQDLAFTTDMDLAEFIYHDTNLKVVSMCDDFIVYGSKERIVNANNTVYIRILKTKVNSLNGFIDYVENELPVLYYELATPIIHEIQLKGYPHIYEDGTVAFNTDIPHKTVVSYNVDQEQLITNQNEIIIRHDKQIDDLYYYIELYLEEIYQMELFRMQVELSL